MRITFLGTRGNIKVHSKKHYRHTVTQVLFGRTSIVIDCGLDWLSRAKKMKANALFISHAHPDHVGGLQKGAPCPVYATQDSWDVMAHYPIEDRMIIRPQQLVTIGRMTIEAFAVAHSLNAPTVGYRISAGKVTVFYVPDLAKIIHPKKALSGVQLYIGDGAIITRTLLLRHRDDTLIGHAPISEQLKWCKRYKVPMAIFTHCGTEITSRKYSDMRAKIKELGDAYNVDAELAYDGMQVTL